MFDCRVPLFGYRRAFQLLSVAACAALAACGGSPAPGVPPTALGVAGDAWIGPTGFSSPDVDASIAPPTPAGSHRANRWLAPAGKGIGRFLYSADSDEVQIFAPGNPPVQSGTISDGVRHAYGLFIDQSGRLYVVNRKGNRVTEYEPRTIEPNREYSGGLNSPLYVTVDAAQDVYVTNSAGSTITAYMSGASAPTSLPSLGSETDGLAFDGSGNLYAAYRNGKKQAGIEYYALGTTIPKDLGISLDQPQGLVIDPAGNVLVAQTGGVNTVDVFPPGQTTPSQQISFSGAPTELALTSSGSTLFVSVLPGAIDKVPLSRPTPLALITGLENLQGVAITPGF